MVTISLSTHECTEKIQTFVEWLTTVKEYESFESVLTYDNWPFFVYFEFKDEEGQKKAYQLAEKMKLESVQMVR